MIAHQRRFAVGRGAEAAVAAGKVGDRAAQSSFQLLAQWVSIIALKWNVDSKKPDNNFK